jgi:hypothetical protein
MTNPFTGKVVVDSSGEPVEELTFLPDEPFESTVKCPALSSFAPENLWPIGSLEVPALGDSFGLPSPTIAGDALFAPRTYGWFLHVLPHNLVEALAAVSDPPRVAFDWRSVLRDSRGDVEFADLFGWIEDWAPIVRSLSRLAQRAQNQSARVFVYQGPASQRVLQP